MGMAGCRRAAVPLCVTHHSEVHQDVLHAKSEFPLAAKTAKTACFRLFRLLLPRSYKSLTPF